MDKENIYKRIAESKQVNAKMILFVFVHRKKTEWNSFSHMHSISMAANMQALNWKKWTKTKSGRKIRTHTNTDRRHKRKLNHSIFSKKQHTSSVWSVMDYETECISKAHNIRTVSANTCIKKQQHIYHITWQAECISLNCTY